MADVLQNKSDAARAYNIEAVKCGRPTNVIDRGRKCKSPAWPLSLAGDLFLRRSDGLASKIPNPNFCGKAALRSLLYKRLGGQYSKFSMKVRPGKLASYSNLATIDLCINNAMTDAKNAIIGAEEEHLCLGRRVVPICWKTDAGVL